MVDKNELTDRVEGLVQRRMSDELATKEEIIDELQDYGEFSDVSRDELEQTPISVLETEGESMIPGAVKTDDGLVLDDFGEALDEAKRKATEGRVYDAENERLRIEWLRAYTEAVAEYRQLAEADA